MSEPVFLAIDAGTTRMKAALMDVRGRTRARVSTDLTVAYPFDGASEMDMTDVWGALCGLTRRLAEDQPGLWPELAGMAIAGQGDGLWPIDGQGRPVGPAILWNDTRSKRMRLPDEAELARYSADHAITPLFPGAVPVLLRWMHQQEPERYARIERALHCKDWLNYCLTGELATDPSDASTAVLNVLEGRYDAGLLERLELPGALARFPEIRPSTAQLGRVTRAAASASGLPEGLIVLVGAIDVAAVALGADALLPGAAVTIVGTTLCNEVVLGRAQVDPADTRGSTLCHVQPGSFLRLMATSNGTSSLDWVRRMVAPGLSFERIEAALAAIGPGSAGVMFHPYLHGERAPVRNPMACGGFYGLTAAHTPMHLLHAAYEGLALSLYDCYQYLPAVTQVEIAGGGAASAVLCQMCADGLNRPVRRSGCAELGLAGAARLVWMGLGLAGGMPLENETSARVFLPDPRRHRIYGELYALFSHLRTGLEPYWLGREGLFNTTMGGC